MNSRDFADLVDHNAGLIDALLTVLEQNKPLRELTASVEEPTMDRIRTLRARLHEGQGPRLKWDDACPCSHCAPAEPRGQA